MCWVTYLATAASIAVVFAFPPSANQYFNGFVADMFGASVIFIFSYFCGNSSLIDPSWYMFPVSQGIFWVAASDGLSDRGMVSFVLLILWAIRFIY